MKKGDPIPVMDHLDLPCINGTEERKETPLLIYFWSISCFTCKDISSKLYEAVKELGEVQVKTIHVPFSEEDLKTERVKRMVKETGFSFPVILDQYHEWVKMFEVQAVPAFFLFDAERRLSRKAMGTDGFEKVKAWLQGTNGTNARYRE